MTITYPYLPEGRTFIYVGLDNPFMKEALEYSRTHSIDKKQPTGSVVVKDGKIIGRGANGSSYHETHECERLKQKVKTGTRYELCEGCHPKNHSEPRAIKNALDNGYDTKGADLYLWGHWWCCEPCWDAIVKGGIKDVYLLTRSEKFFNKDSSENVLERQFKVF